MTPKEKALELVREMYGYIFDGGKHEEAEDAWFIAKQCALKAVDEIIKSRKDDDIFDDYMSVGGSDYYTPHPMYLTYWLQVKEEIDKI